MSGFRMKGSPKRTPLLSQYGVITGGDHDGWRYAFERFELGARGAMRVVLVATKPNWPFPTTIRLTGTAFGKLEGVPGERAPKIDTTPLIAAALAVQPPAATPQQAARRRRSSDRLLRQPIPTDAQLEIT